MQMPIAVATSCSLPSTDRWQLAQRLRLLREREVVKRAWASSVSASTEAAQRPSLIAINLARIFCAGRRARCDGRARTKRITTRETTGLIAKTRRVLPEVTASKPTIRPKRKFLNKKALPSSGRALNWVHGFDLNQRPSGYEPERSITTPRLCSGRDLPALKLRETVVVRPANGSRTSIRFFLST